MMLRTMLRNGYLLPLLLASIVVCGISCSDDACSDIEPYSVPDFGVCMEDHHCAVGSRVCVENVCLPSCDAGCQVGSFEGRCTGDACLFSCEAYAELGNLACAGGPSDPFALPAPDLCSVCGGQYCDGG